MTHALYQAIFAAARALEVPVIIAALLALAVTVVELGAFLAETAARRKRPAGARAVAVLAEAAGAARAAIDDARPVDAARALHEVAWSAAMQGACTAFAEHAALPDTDSRLAKDLADFDFGRQRRLGRTRLLVRFGPALGLMGTLIPLSPALEGLAKGNVGTLTENLRVAFSVTVLGLLIGAVAFALSLLRERIYGQDYSDLEFVAALLTSPALDGQGRP